MSTKTSHRRTAQQQRRQRAHKVLTEGLLAQPGNLKVVYGICTHCRAVEVELNHATGVRTVEGTEYPVGYGCEVCA